MPLIALSFDRQVIADTSLVFRAAAKALVKLYRVKKTKIPTIRDFQRGAPLNFHAWGVPEVVPYEDAYGMFKHIVLGIEGRESTPLRPGIAEALSDISHAFNIIILTPNAIHPVAEMIENQSGIKVKAEVVVVKDKKGPVLDFLAGYHRLYHPDVPFYFFADSEMDIHVARHGCGSGVHPVAVMPKELLPPKNHDRKKRWKESMEFNGAEGFVGPRRIAPVVFGEYDLELSLGNGRHIT